MVIFQIEFGKQVEVNSIVIAGGAKTLLCYMAEFKLQYSYNKVHWWQVLNGNGKPKVIMDIFMFSA